MNNELINEVATISAMIGSPARIKILQILAGSPKCVETIANETGETIGNTSQHLQKLLNLNLVKVEKNKLKRIYSVSNIKIAIIIDELFGLAEEISQKAKAISREISSEEILCDKSIESIVNEIELGKSILVDVRDEEDSSNSKIPHSLAIPYSKIKTQIGNFSKTKKYFVICQGPACERASEIVRKLRNKGIKAFRIKECPQTIIEKIKKE